MIHRRSQYYRRSYGPSRKEERASPDASLDSPEELPIDREKGAIKRMIAKYDTALITAATGAGKTVRGPVFIREAVEELGLQGRVAVVEPRRNIAITVSEYIAETNGYAKGEVGYQVRSDSHANKGEKLNFMTDGIMLRKLIDNPLLLEYDAVMVDEAHERSLNVDAVMGLLKEVQKRRAAEGHPPIKIVISSATIEKEKFAAYFNLDAEAIADVEGRLFPVEERYVDTMEVLEDYMRAAAEKCREIVMSGDDGDILVVMPGVAEIANTIKHLKKFPEIVKQCDILELHASLSNEDQKRVLGKSGGRRRIIVATNIAETGVTIDGVRHVVDSGFIKNIRYDPKSDITALVTEEHSLAGLKQRCGRAGRTAPGRYHALYSKESMSGRLAYSEPEIQRTNIATIVLFLKRAGIDDVKSFDFIDKPAPEAVDASIQQLIALGALDADEHITSIGEFMADLPLEPRMARMIAESVSLNCVNDAVTIAAFFSNQQKLFSRPRGKEDEADKAHRRFQDPDSDFFTWLNIGDECRTVPLRDLYKWANQHFLNGRAINTIRQERGQILDILRRKRIYANSRSERSRTNVSKAIITGFISNLMVKTGRYGYKGIDNDTILAFIHPSSGQFQDVPPPFIIAGELLTTSKTYMSPVHKVDPEHLSAAVPYLLERRNERLQYDPKSDSVYQHADQRVPSHWDTSLNSELPPIKKRTGPTPEASREFAEYLANHAEVSDFTKHNEKVKDAYEDLRVRNGGTIQGALFPERTIDQALSNLYVKTLAEAGNLHSLQAVRKNASNLSFSLDQFVSQETQREIREQNPDTIAINGKEFPVSYAEDRYSDDCYASVVLEDADIHTLSSDTTLSLPSGRDVYFVQKEDSDEHRFRDVASLKRGFRNRLATAAWYRWTEDNPDIHHQPQSSLNLLSSDTSLPDLPDPVVYGDDPLTGEPLLAYPALYKTIHGRYTISYFQGKDEADKEHAATLGKVRGELNLIRDKKEKRRIKEAFKELADTIDDLLEQSLRDANGESALRNLKKKASQEERTTYVYDLKVKNNILNQLQEELSSITAVEELYDESDGMIEEQVQKLVSKSQLPHTLSVEQIREGGVSVSSDVLENIDFKGGDWVAASEVVVTKQNAKAAYIAAQLIIEEDGSVFLTEDADTLRGLRWDEHAWTDGIAGDVHINTYDILLSDEERKRREKGVPDESYFDGMSVEELEEEYSRAKDPERKEMIRQKLIEVYTEKIDTSTNMMEIALFKAKRKDIS